MGGLGVSRPPNIFKFARKLDKKASRATRGLATVFSVTFFFNSNLVTIVGQLMSRHITDLT